MGFWSTTPTRKWLWETDRIEFEWQVFTSSITKSNEFTQAIYAYKNNDDFELKQIVGNIEIGAPIMFGDERVGTVTAVREVETGKEFAYKIVPWLKLRR